MDIILVTNKKPTKMMPKLKILDDTVEGREFLIYSGIDASASVNRNHGLDRVESDIFIMMDDDIDGFYSGWVNDLVTPMLKDESIIVTSARLLKEDGTKGFMMGDNKNYSPGVHEAEKTTYKGYYRIPTACLAIRKNDLRFDEGFIGSGYEDTDFLNRLNVAFPHMKMVINNDCQLIHYNNMTKQGGQYFEHNKKYYLSKYPDDHTVINQQDWTKR